MLGTATRQLAYAARSALQARPVSQMRSMHVTSPVWKKKRGAAVELDDMFEEFEIVDESVKAQPDATPKPPAASSSSSSAGGKRKLSSEDRRGQFDEIVAFVKPRLGRSPAVKGDYARNASWLRLLQLATSKEQLEQVVGLMPQWKESGRKFDSTFSQAFVRRCQELSAQPLALQVFGDYAKYNVPLDLVSGRQLVHSLHRQSIQELMAASAFYNLYGLSPVSQDLVSCSIIVFACLRHNSPESNAIAEALLPHLRQLKESTPVDVNDTYHRENRWVQMALTQIDHKLTKRNIPPLGPPLAKEATISA